jgi:hypothetical protein
MRTFAEIVRTTKPFNKPPAIECPKCGESIDHQSHQDAEPENNMPEIVAGYYCTCGWEEKHGMTRAEVEDYFTTKGNTL